MEGENVYMLLVTMNVAEHGCVSPPSKQRVATARTGVKLYPVTLALLSAMICCTVYCCRVYATVFCVKFEHNLYVRSSSHCYIVKLTSPGDTYWISTDSLNISCLYTFAYL